MKIRRKLIKCESKPCIQGDNVELLESEKVQGDLVEMTKRKDKYNEGATCVMCYKLEE